MPWQHWALIVLYAFGVFGTMIDPNTTDDRKATLVMVYIAMAGLLVWGQS